MVQAPLGLTTQELANLAVNLIRQAGCEYGDIRLCNYRNQRLSARDRSLKNLADNVSSGFGVRVLLDGAWGFAASYRKTAEEVTRIVNLAVDIAKGKSFKSTRASAISSSGSISGSIYYADRD